MAITERDTCRKYVLPKLQAVGWEDDPRLIQEEKTFTDGRIVVAGGTAKRRKRKRADYLLRYTRDFMIAVVEAKSAYKNARDGLPQAKDYAEILRLKFAYATKRQADHRVRLHHRQGDGGSRISRRRTSSWTA